VTGRSVPVSTLRLQLEPRFTLDDAAAVVDDVAALGVTHLYLSPLLQATPGSAHGYDVVDHTQVAEDLGGESGWSRLLSAARRAGLGIVVDIVPNHMAVPVPEINTAGEPATDPFEPGSDLPVEARSTILLRCPRESPEDAAP
jgi:(1->4)-alpha-D-glucan 1-alpha-D-glucosylmutase